MEEQPMAAVEQVYQSISSGEPSSPVKAHCEHCKADLRDDCDRGMVDGSACPQMVQLAYQRSAELRVKKVSDLWPIPKRFIEAHFHPKLGDHDPSRAEACQIVRNYIRDLCAGNVHENLILTGPHGTGKTWIAAAAVKLARSLGMTAIFTEITSFLSQIRSTYEQHGPSAVLENDIFRAFADADLVCFDDIGKQRDTAWTDEILWQAIDIRYRNCRPIMLTCDASSDNIFRTGSAGAILSRLAEDLIVVQITGASLRGK